MERGGSLDGHPMRHKNTLRQHDEIKTLTWRAYESGSYSYGRPGCVGEMNKKGDMLSEY
jgi:hypothetical protein